MSQDALLETPLIIDTTPGRPGRKVTLPASPENLHIDADATALVVVDMQNAYSTIGGYVDRAGFDISGAQSVIANIGLTIEAARAAGVPVIYFQNGWDPDYIEAGGPGSPNFHKSNAMKYMRANPEAYGELLAKGTWDYAIIDELQPQPGDIVVAKTRYSGFFNSTMDSTLRARGIRNLIFVGIATNVCVESSLRDAFHLEYFGVVLKDATHHLGPVQMQEASLYNIGKFFGWVSDTAGFCGAIRQMPPNSAPEIQ